MTAKAGKRPKRKPAKRNAPAEERSAPSSLFKWISIALVLLALAPAVMLLGVYPRSSGPGQGATVEIDIQNTAPDALADTLHAAGLVANSRVFAWYVRLSGGGGSIVTGPHYVTDDCSPGELLHRLERRGASHVKLVVPEGWTRFDIAKRVDTLHICTGRSFLRASEDPALLAELRIPFDSAKPSAEGFLFPATYDLELDSDPREVVRRMVHQFDKRYAALEEKHEKGIQDLEDSLHFGKRQILILAAMVEKEAAVDDERPVIASVFLNRLRDPSFLPKLLQCDPTAGYGCLVGSSAACASYTGKITHEINFDPDNVYSTYTREGLPPGPIANPGARSIEAVMDPALTHYFFFVAKGGGRHTFSETLGAHNAAVHGGK